MYCKKKEGFLLLETLVSVFVFLIAVNFLFYLYNTAENLFVRAKSRFFTCLLACFQMEKILASDFQDIVSFKTCDFPDNEWSKQIQTTGIKNASGELEVIELNSNLKKVIVSVFYENDKKNEKTSMETLVVK